MIATHFSAQNANLETLYDFHTELWLHDYVAFSDEELLHYLQRDERFVVNGDSPVNAEISVARKRKKAEQ